VTTRLNLLLVDTCWEKKSFFLQVFRKLEVSIFHSLSIPLSISSIKANYIDIYIFWQNYCLLSFSFKAHFRFLSPSLLISNTEIIHILCMTGAVWIVLVPTVSRGIHWTIGYYWPPSLIKTMRTYWLPNTLSHT
jgi:hypothetical protein